ncbi:50S ribosomal protein L17 [Candidatus Collierbacteria bacterium CG10_big_fil_rev_8_21_14_0_10_44_9]|uniref:50S ribosomal protein L17 n=1 Tax=Candidatus Collierbacteria bacterium CG10_big_fil_rev_8_21_14_0_10_44_9 TaxID=1974535 RepID=A0A2H0VJP1_9BACT|nr:MAG: 50S ribosomal protein L17 [Candidatus Collierbacteria bacterium CG10_big_fil_rev_8_21_14_0_10_44_9]
MKKHISGYKLNHDSAARLALMKNLVYSLIQHDAIVTTKIKAKAVTPIFEKLITRAKVDTVQNRRMVQAYIQENTLVKKLFTVIAPLYKEVKGGYTKLTVIGNRHGDNAPLVRLSLTKKSVVSPVKEKTKATVSPRSSKSEAGKAVVPEVIKATGAAPKLVKRTGKRGDK